ncbi:MAG: hypothetical protein HN742_06670 [Lentisphaerae bacterium]|jgi:hypothetical protein|nr:hypothetical protein [Lentisphaerota bacterium]MBT4818694.1 hypothetical protein [Lentisphaerota bacterium]MBT5609956.1 hypothetical protein [Lentisphaerota bacterium]MBT7060455.1 hypothetical protein [Lentisphaerota bacterium]MBT7841536.1 hypothetical protein [Lentisphaerota bacterium]
MIPTIDFFGTQVSRLFLGDNPINGHSYIPEICPGEEMMDYFTAQKVVEALFEAEELGYTTCLPLANGFMLRVIRQYRNEGGKMNWIFQPFPAIAVEVNARQMGGCDPLATYHQGTTTDGLIESGQVDVLLDNIEKLRVLGKPVGLGTHVPETILRSEEEGWGVDFYMACLHNTRKRGGEASSFITGKKKHLKFFIEDRQEMFDVIQQVQKPCIAFKVLAGGQLFYGKTPEEIPGVVEDAFRETFAKIKPTDLATVGFFQRDKDQLRENADIAERILAEG